MTHPPSRNRRRRLAAVLATALTVGSAFLSAPAAQAAAAPAFTFKILGCTALRGDYSYDIEVAKSGRTALVVGDDHVQKLDVTKSTAKVLGTSTAAWGTKLSIHPNSTVAYVASTSADKVFVLDITGTPKVVATLAVTNVKDVKVTPAGKYLYVVNEAIGEARPYLRIYSLASPKKPTRVGTALKLPNSARSLAIAPNAKTVAVTMFDRVALISLAKPTVPKFITSAISLPFYADAVTYGRDSKTIFAGDSIEPTYARIDVAKRRVTSTRTINQVSDKVTDLEVSSDNRLLWVTTASTDTENSVYAFGVTSGKAYFTGKGIYAPDGLGISTAGPSKGSVYFPSLIDDVMCGVKQSSS